MNGIEGKVVVVTGASSGIGEATALLLAERCAKVVLGARGSDRLKALARRIEASEGDAAYIHTDVKRRDDLSNIVGLAVERYGKPDVLHAPVVNKVETSHHVARREARVIDRTKRRLRPIISYLVIVSPRSYESLRPDEFHPH
jgi:NADP-dependent 3-hydroxy acid dehydrogenase YdfG